MTITYQPAHARKRAGKTHRPEQSRFLGFRRRTRTAVVPGAPGGGEHADAGTAATADTLPGAPVVMEDLPQRRFTGAQDRNQRIGGGDSQPWRPAPVPDGAAPVPPADIAAANTAADYGHTTATGAPRPFAPEQGDAAKPEPPVWLRTLRGGRAAGDDIALWGTPVYIRLADLQGGGKLAEVDMGASRGGNCLIAADSDYLRTAARVFTAAADACDAADAAHADPDPEPAGVTEDAAWAAVVADAEEAAGAQPEAAPVLAAEVAEPAQAEAVTEAAVEAEAEERAGEESGAEGGPEAKAEAA